MSILTRLCHDAKRRLVNCSFLTTIRQMAFCWHKHMIVKLYMYIEALKELT